MPKDDEEAPEKTGESEDTDSEEEDKSEDDSDDSGEEPSKKEGEEEEVEQFFDPNKVPPQLKGAFKKMQAANTRVMQKHADSIRKGEAFEELTTIPEFKLFISDMESGKGYGASSVYARVNGNSKAKNSEDDEDEEAPGAKEGKLSVKAIMSVLAPLIRQEIAAAVGPLRLQETERLQDKLRDEDPDFDSYLPDITKLRKRHPTMSLQEAYDLVSGKEASSRRPKVSKETLKKTRTEGGGGTKTGVDTLTPKTARTLREALEQGYEAATGKA